MDELKILVDMVANLPSMALWVIAAFWAYKVIVIGSVYGLIRFGIEKLHNYLIKPKEVIRKVDLGKDIVNEDVANSLLALIQETLGVNGYSHVYIHQHHVEWIRTAVREKKERDGKK